jgi:hypothetical protein
MNTLTFKKNYKIGKEVLSNILMVDILDQKAGALPLSDDE